MRYLKLVISYDGTDYGGWQVQPNAITIQEKIEDAFEKLTSHRPRVLASGRTDAGVHAAGQVVACPIESALPCETILRATNAHLPDDIRVLSVTETTADFHPIRDAIQKRYRYTVDNSPFHDVFSRLYAWHIPEPLNFEAMTSAAAKLIGELDCKCFETSGSPRNSTIRHLIDVEVSERRLGNGRQLLIEVEANGFLYNMMRNIVGTLVVIGRGRQNVSWLDEVLASRDRRQAGPTAPAHGLCLLHVTYP